MSVFLTKGSNLEAKNPWYREPMVLMVVSIPAIAVVVSFTMLAISIMTFDGVVVDDYYRHGKEINQVLHRDNEARSLGIVAHTQFDQNLVTVNLTGFEEFEWPDKLTLRILHPTQAGRDNVVDVVRQADGAYVATMPEVRSGDWIVQIETPQWRLSKRVSLVENSRTQLGSDQLINEGPI